MPFTTILQLNNPIKYRNNPIFNSEPVNVYNSFLDQNDEIRAMVFLLYLPRIVLLFIQNNSF